MGKLLMVNSLTAIDAHEHQLFSELRSIVVFLANFHPLTSIECTRTSSFAPSFPIFLKRFALMMYKELFPAHFFALVKKSPFVSCIVW